MRQNRRQEIKSRITHGALHVHTIKSIISLLSGPSCKLIKMVFQHIELMTPLRARKVLPAGVLKPHLLSKMYRIGNNLHGEVAESSRNTFLSRSAQSKARQDERLAPPSASGTGTALLVGISTVSLGYEKDCWLQIGVFCPICLS